MGTVCGTLPSAMNDSLTSSVSFPILVIHFENYNHSSRQEVTSCGFNWTLIAKDGEGVFRCLLDTFIPFTLFV